MFDMTMPLVPSTFKTYLALLYIAMVFMLHAFFSIAVFPGYSIAVMAYYAMSDWYKAMKGTDVNVLYKMLKE